MDFLDTRPWAEPNAMRITKELTDSCEYALEEWPHLPARMPGTVG